MIFAAVNLIFYYDGFLILNQTKYGLRAPVREHIFNSMLNIPYGHALDLSKLIVIIVVVRKTPRTAGGRLDERPLTKVSYVGPPRFGCHLKHSYHILRLIASDKNKNKKRRQRSNINT